MAHDHHHDTHDSAHEQGHGHGDGHTHTHDHADIDWAEMAPHLEAQAELYTPLYRQALGWLAREVTDPGLVVDVGSGPGVVSCLFAETSPAPASSPPTGPNRCSNGPAPVPDAWGSPTASAPSPGTCPARCPSWTTPPT